MHPPKPFTFRVPGVDGGGTIVVDVLELDPHEKGRGAVCKMEKYWWLIRA